MRWGRAVLVATLSLLLLSHASAAPAKLPVYVEVFVRATGKMPRDQKVAGGLLRFDDERLTVRSGRTERELKWIELTPTSAYAARLRTIDRDQANDWLELARFAWKLGAQPQAKLALATAVKLDASLKRSAEEVLSSEPGSALRPPATSPSKSNELAPGPSVQRIDKSKVVKYQAVSPAEHARAIEAAREMARTVGKTLSIELTEIQTDHFIIFTDWDPREFDFLRTNLEGAYARVSEEFEIPVKENVFVGKLPVFMLARHERFRKFARTIDRFPAGETVLGYYGSRDDGADAHMAMWKPAVTGNNVAEAERRWAYVLTHEFTHAFVARYRSNQAIPRWLNEGVAEVITNGKFPRPGARDLARAAAFNGTNLMQLFDDARMPSGEMYPVMMTMAQTLIARDRRAFLRYFDDIKAGVEPEEALKKNFGWDNQSLLAAWKTYITTSN